MSFHVEGVINEQTGGLSNKAKEEPERYISKLTILQL